MSGKTTGKRFSIPVVVFVLVLVSAGNTAFAQPVKSAEAVGTRHCNHL